MSWDTFKSYYRFNYARMRDGCVNLKEGSKCPYCKDGHLVRRDDVLICNYCDSEIITKGKLNK